MRERIADDLRERLADRLADGLSQLAPEQRDALRTALRQRFAAEVRDGLPDRLANQLSDGRGEWSGTRAFQTTVLTSCSEQATRVGAPPSALPALPSGAGRVSRMQMRETLPLAACAGR